MIILAGGAISWARNSRSPISHWSPTHAGPAKVASSLAAIPMCKAGSGRSKKIWVLPMRRDMFLGLALVLAASSAFAADNLDLARRLGRYDGGVTVLLKNFEGGVAASTAAPDIFRQSYDQAITDNQPVIAAADEQIARVYAGLFSTALLSAEVDFYESPEGQSIVARNRAP